MENKKELIYDNGDIKLKHLTRVQFRSLSNNKIMDGIIIGQEATKFIIWTDKGKTAKAHTQDILQIAVITGNEEFFVSLNDYKELSQTT